MDRTIESYSLFIDDYFYLAVISLIYWTVNKNVGFKLLIVFAFSVYVHGLINDTLSKAIPSISSSSSEPIFPSRDIQVAASFWGYLIPEVSDRRFTIFSCIILLLLSISAWISGGYSLQQIGSALLLGAFVVYIVYRSADWIGSVPEPIIFAFCLVLPSSLLLLFPEGAAFAGLLLGGGTGYCLERIKVRMVFSNKWVIRFLSGSAGIAGLVIIAYIEQWLPSTTLFQFLHASLAGAWITLFYPLIMIKTGLYKQQESFIIS